MGYVTSDATVVNIRFTLSFWFTFNPRLQRSPSNIQQWSMIVANGLPVPRCENSAAWKLSHDANTSATFYTSDNDVQSASKTNASEAQSTRAADPLDGPNEQIRNPVMDLF